FEVSAQKSSASSPRTAAPRFFLTHDLPKRQRAPKNSLHRFAGSGVEPFEDSAVADDGHDFGGGGAEEGVFDGAFERAGPARRIVDCFELDRAPAGDGFGSN